MIPKDIEKAHPNIRSRYIKTLIRCPLLECNKPIGERLGNQWWFMNKQGHTVMKTAMEIDQSAPQGSYRVKCPDENCLGGHIFVWINETVVIKDKFNVIVNQDINS